MKFKAKLPDESVNVSEKNPLKELGVLLLGMTGVFLSLYLILGFFVDSAIAALPLEVEQRWSKSLEFELGDGAIESHPRLDSIMKYLQESSGDTTPVEIHLLKEKGFNAFAAPGLKIYVLQDLVDSVQSDEELAFVLAHELGHFQGRHHLRGLGRSVVLTIVSLFFFGQNSEVVSFFTPAIGSLQNHYSREQEREADEFGAQMLYNAYGSLDGGIDFFKRLQKLDNTPEFLKWMSTHPGHEERLDFLKTWTP